MKEKKKTPSLTRRISRHAQGYHHYSSAEKIEQPTIDSVRIELIAIERASPEPGQQLVVEANGRFDKGNSHCRRQGTLMIADQKFHHSVYVILLEPGILRHPSIIRLNPNRDPAKPCVYVGMTGLPVEQRFENHKKGVKEAWVVAKYGIRLMPELYEYLNPMPFEAAAQMEKDLAADLRAEGYTVTGGT